MTADKLLERAWRAYRGKTADKTPAWGSDKANLVLDIANQKKDEYARDTKVHRSACFEIKDVDTIDTSTLTYELDAGFLTPSGNFLVAKTNGDLVEIELTKPELRDKAVAYIWGRNPRKVTFNGTIDSALDGGTLKAPGYYLPDDLTASDDVVPVDDPDWLVYAVAAELSRNDPAKEDQFANLIGMANELYSRMSIAEDDLGYNQNNTVPVEMPIIGDYSDSSALDF